MPKKLTPLSDVQCRAHRHKAGKPSASRLRDGGGLILEALPSGRKVWRMEYRHAGKRNMATLAHDYGSPGGSLSNARLWRATVKDQLAQGLDPNQQAKAQEQAQRAAALATFEAAASEWLGHKSTDWAPSTTEKVKSTLDNVLLPWLSKRPVGEITPQELLHCLQRYEAQGKRSTAHNARTYAGQIFRRAIVLGLRTDDPAAALKGALKPKNESNMAHLSNPEAIGGLLRAINNYPGNPVVRAALRLLPMLFCRPGELRQARWSEFDLEAALWEIPASRMKTGRTHLVPLAPQAVVILRELEDLTKRTPESLLFPGIRHRCRPISENTINAALRSLGYDRTQQTGHGFRHIASTQLHEQGWPSHVIEAQLSHADRNSIRGKYNKAEYLAERKEMMAAWADRLSRLSQSSRQ